MIVVDVFPLDGVDLPSGLLVAAEAVPAGFPSPAEGYWFGDLDLNDHLIKDKTSSAIIRADGDSMLTTIAPGDRLLVDRSITPVHGHIIVAAADGELIVSRFLRTRRGVTLAADNPAYPDLHLTEWTDTRTYGVATWVLRPMITLPRDRMALAEKPDLTAQLMPDAASTFVIRVAGDSMLPTITSGDRVIVDRSILPRAGHVIIAILDGELTVKRLLQTPHGLVLAADNPAYPQLQLTDWSDARSWGVVTWALHPLL